MLFMLGPGEEYWRRTAHCVCGHSCSFEIDVCPSCEHNLRLLCECDSCSESFWYDGQERCPNCGASIPDYENRIPQIELVIAKHHIGLTFMTVDTPYVFYRDHALLPAKDARVQAARSSFGIPQGENIYAVIIAQRQLTNDCKGFAICEHGIYCRDTKEWHGLIRWNDFSSKRNMPIKSFMGIIQIGTHDFNVIKHSECSCSDLMEYLKDLQYYIESDGVKWSEETEEEFLYYEESQGGQNPSAISSLGSSLVARILKTTVARNAFSESGIVCQNGLPIANNKAEKARTSFCIPEADDIYFIASGQMMGGISENSKGFAITTSGIYYRTNSRECGIYDWEVFSNIQIVGNTLTYVRIGSIEFQVSGQKKILKLLLDLQSEIRNNLKPIIAELQAVAQQREQKNAEQIKIQEDIQFIKNAVRSTLLEDYDMTTEGLSKVDDVLCMFADLRGMDAEGIVCFFKEKNIEFTGASTENIASYIERSPSEKVADWVLRQLVAIFQIKKKTARDKSEMMQQSMSETPKKTDSTKKFPATNTEIATGHNLGKICPSCKSENKSTARFCASCGSPLDVDRFCTQCGAKLRPGKKFCSGCGAKIE